MGWWVNDPNGQSVSYPTKQRARNVARQVKGASVSKGSPKGGKHKGGCLSLVLTVVGLILALASLAMH